MKNLRLTVLLVIMILVPTAGIVYSLSIPRLLEVSPAPDAARVPASASLRLTFSHEMQDESVRQRLSFDPARTGAFTWEDNTLVFTPDEPWSSGQRVSVRLESGARAAGLLSLPVREETDWSFTIGEPRLVFLYPANAAANLYVVNPSSGEREQLTDVLGGVLEYDANEDGSALYYSVRNGDGGSDLYRLSLAHSVDGNPAEPQAALMLRCARASCRAPKVSPDERFLAFERSDPLDNQGPSNTGIWLLPIETSVETTSIPGESFRISQKDHESVLPQWSPDGLLTYYDTLAIAFVALHPEGNERVEYPNQTGQDGDWSPDGASFIAAESMVFQPGNPEVTGLDSIAGSHLMRYNRLDGQIKDLTVEEVMEDVGPVFSPNGQTLAFARRFIDVTRWSPGRQLWVMNWDGSQARPLTADALYNHYDFTWDPTGKLLAYVRFHQTILTEPPEIWLMDPATTRARRLIQGGYAPQWIP